MKDDGFSQASDGSPQKNVTSSLTTGSNSNMNSVFADNPEFYQQAGKFTFAFTGLLISYLTWGYMQELIMTSEFKPFPRHHCRHYMRQTQARKRV